MAEKIKCKVIGPAEVDGVAAPGTVELDPDVVNIGALVYAGHIEVPKSVDLDKLPDPTPDAGGTATSASGPKAK
ncbi:hypothetical protein [Planobispora longispora]|uniref:Uncharacterized protein n=1 Tax=Planobispora longispora TaxID=28887 RepID=A0A8J3RJP8_9ACTN|nr:hypothetical protein [Planobispora longispora]BFE85828.1 hypothetical protein GCM10020093_084290 [Planobispora longispora]GIH76140.1 hypothetical protein Plo01_25690 [Planobispora longispora]